LSNKGGKKVTKLFYFKDLSCFFSISKGKNMI
jgi:hypothetical protein